MKQKPTIKIKRLSFQGSQSTPLAPDTTSWSTQYLIDELYLSLMNVKEIFCMINGNRKASVFSDPKQLDNKCNAGRGITRRLYEEQAKYKMYRLPIFRPSPIFVVYLRHLDDRLKRELANLDRETKDLVMKEAIGRIFEQVDRRFYLLSVKPLLQWGLEY